MSEDPVFDLHRGGKMAVMSTVPLSSREDLSLAYTPGVAEVCEAIAADASLARGPYTWVGHTVAVVTDGSAVLGLGNIGPRAAMPVMEGKAVLFKQFGGVDAVPICLDTQDIEEIIADRHRVGAVVRRASTWRTSPRPGASRSSAGWTRRCRSRSSTTTSTAPPSWCWPRCATRPALLDRKLDELRVVDQRSRRGRGGRDQDAHRRRGARHRRLRLAGDHPQWTDRAHLGEGVLGRVTNPRRPRGGIADALRGADVLIGVSGGSIDEEAVAGMAPGGAIFALANPTPEVHPKVAGRYAAVVATGRSDFPNQINNVLAFPGVFRGALDAGRPASPRA